MDQILYIILFLFWLYFQANSLYITYKLNFNFHGWIYLTYIDFCVYLAFFLKFLLMFPFHLYWNPLVCFGTWSLLYSLCFLFSFLVLKSNYWFLNSLTNLPCIFRIIYNYFFLTIISSNLLFTPPIHQYWESSHVSCLFPKEVMISDLCVSTPAFHTQCLTLSAKFNLVYYA